MRYCTRLSLAALLACLVLPQFFLSERLAFAQQTPNAEPGFQAEGVYDFNGIDNVSLFNGALSLTIPLGVAYPAGGGFSHQLRLVYHSTFWDSFVYSSPCPSPSECPVGFRPKNLHDAGLGWRLALPRLIPPGEWNQTTAWIYVSADGGEHTFYDKLHFTDTDDSGDSGFDQLVRYTRDGTYLRFKRPNETSTTVTVELPGGDIHTFNQSGGEWLLSSMKDRFGNGLDLIRGTDGSGNATLTLDDGFRQHTVTYQDQVGSPDQPSLISTIDLAAFDGETATYSFQYATKTVFRPAAHTHPDPTDRSISVRLLQSVTLPGSNGAYEFGSVANPAYRAEGYVTQMRLPTLGYLEWDWEPYGFPKLRTLPPNQEDGEAVDPYSSVFGVSKRRQKNISGNTLGEWTYVRSFEPSLDAIGELPERLTVAVERPLGDKSEHYFSVYPAKENLGQPAPQWGTKWTEYSLPYTRSEQDPFGGDRYLSSKIFDCDENGNGCELKRAEYVAYELDDASTVNDDTGRLFNKNRRQKSRRIVDYYVDSAGQSQTDYRLEVSSNFDGLGHYRDTTVTSDFGPTRSSQTTFNAGQGTYPGSFQQIHKDSPWILNTFGESSRTESSVTSKQEFCFNGQTGFLERSRTLRLGNDQRSTTDLIQSFTADSRGQIAAQLWYGGDLVPVGTGNLCGLTLGTSSFRMSNTYQSGVLKTSRYTYHDGSVDSGSSGGPLTYFEVQNTSIDQDTGLVETSLGPSGLSTSYDFDGLGRLRLIKPSAASGAAWTKIWFGTAQNTSNPARAEVRELPNGSVDNNDALTEKHYRWDGLGRLARERVALPASSGVQFTDRYHAYDAEGRSTITSTWNNNWNTSTVSAGFDPFGRPRFIYPPDASESNPGHRVEMFYEGFRRIIRTVHIGTELDADAQTVTEHPVSRTEQYDAYGRLTAVTEPSGSGGSNVTTSYTYDLGDRLTQASTPVPGGHQTRAWTYDQRGFLTLECHPELGNGCTRYLSYNAMGNPREWKTARSSANTPTTALAVA